MPVACLRLYIPIWECVNRQRQDGKDHPGAGGGSGVIGRSGCYFDLAAALWMAPFSRPV